MSDILITGTTGQVGSELLRLFPGASAPTRAELDLTDAGSIRAFIQRTKPRWILNPAAYTAVDKAESEPDLAYAINAEAPRILAEEAVKIGAAIIHFSTDYVFDGSGTTPWRESDPTGPLGVYGASKLAGEQALAASGAPHIVLRTSWVYGATGKNFLLTILRLAAQKSEMNIVADQHGAPTAARDLATLTAHLVAHHDPESLTPLSGIYHAAAQGETTWHGFAAEALRQAAALAPATTFATLHPIPSSAYPTPAQRPLNSRLNCDRLHETFGFRIPPWDASLAVVLDLLYAHPAE